MRDRIEVFVEQVDSTTDCEYCNGPAGDPCLLIDGMSTASYACLPCARELAAKLEAACRVAGPQTGSET